MSNPASILPTGWKLLSVKDAFAIRNNLRKPISQEEREKIQGEYPYYGPTKAQGYISSYEQDGKFALIGEDGDHFLKYQNISMTQLISGKCTVNNHAHVVQGTEICTAEWFYYFFMHKELTSFLTRQGAGRFKLNKAALEKIPVLVPPVAEQTKIAQILSTWDKAIATTERLLANSQQQKQALMQQLLTGQKRFAGFTETWKDFHLSDVAEIIVSPVDKKTEPNEIPVELCNYTDVYYNNCITRKINFMRATATQSEIERFTLQIGDVVITKDSETPGDIAVPALVSEDLGGVVCGYHLAIIRCDQKNACGEYMNHLFAMPKTRYYFFTLATGATRFGLSVGGIHNAHFNLPSLVEQQKIAQVLSTADAEISNLQAQLAKLKLEKKALMQQLLTGQRRVKLDADAAA